MLFRSGKDKDTAPSPTPAPDAKEKEKGTRGGKNLVGRINNLVSSDLSSLDNICMYFIFASACSRPLPPLVLLSLFAGALTRCGVVCVCSDRVAVPDHALHRVLVPDPRMEVCRPPS